MLDGGWRVVGAQQGLPEEPGDSGVDGRQTGKALERVAPVARREQEELDSESC